MTTIKIVDWSGGKKIIREVPAPAVVVTVEDVNAEMARRLNALVADYPSQERETFFRQVEQARAVLADANAPAPIVRARAEARGQTVKDMARRILTLADALDDAVAAVMAARDAIVALDPIPADYASDSRWPERAHNA